MLKRRRPSTPPPALAHALSASDFPFEDLDNSAKRRRVVAPTLNGQERGLQPDDRDWADGREEEADTLSGAAEVVSVEEEQAGDYKDTNAMLHRLHREHLCRSQSFIDESSCLPARNNFLERSFPGSPDHHTHKARLTQHSELLPAPSGASAETNIAEEADQVRVRYEENNRLLGLLVRKRKREQGLNPE